MYTFLGTLCISLLKFKDWARGLAKSAPIDILSNNEKIHNYLIYIPNIRYILYTYQPQSKKCQLQCHSFLLAKMAKFYLRKDHTPCCVEMVTRRHSISGVRR